jgi:signal transduction histidine kinase
VKYLPRNLKLRTILVGVGICSLILPVGAFGLLRIYQNELIRQTESELISQAVILSELISVEMWHSPSDEIALRCAPPSNMDPKVRAILAVLHNPNEIPRDDKVDSNAIFPSLHLLNTTILDETKQTEVRPFLATPSEVSFGQKIRPLLENVGSKLLSGIRLTNYQGIVISGSSKDSVHSFLGGREEFLGARTGNTVSLLRKRESNHPNPPLNSISRAADIRVFVAKPLLWQGLFCGSIILSRTPTTIQYALYPFRWQIAAATAFLVGLMTVIATVISRTLSDPLQQLGRHASFVASGGRVKDVGEASFRVEEFDELAKSIQKMAVSLENQAEAINAFALHVSHELKTPLTSIIGASEILYDHAGEFDREDVLKFNNMILEDATRMTGMLNSLLKFTKAANVRASLQICEFSLEPILQRLLERFGPKCHSFKVTNTEAPEVLGDAALTESILQQLLQNAVLYGGGNVQINIRREQNFKTSGSQIASQKNIPYIAIDVINDGPEISASNLKKIFELFFTTSASTGGTGMGLPISRKMAEVQNGSLTCESLPGLTKFSLTLPASCPN